MTPETVCYKNTIPIISCMYRTLLIVQGEVCTDHGLKGNQEPSRNLQIWLSTPRNSFLCEIENEEKEFFENTILMESYY